MQKTVEWVVLNCFLCPTIKKRRLCVTCSSLLQFRFFFSLQVFACIFKKTIQNKMTGSLHSFHKVPLSVTMPDTGEKSMNKVSGSGLRVLAEKVTMPRAQHCAVTTKWGAFWAEFLCLPKLIYWWHVEMGPLGGDYIIWGHGGGTPWWD